MSAPKRFWPRHKLKSGIFKSGTCHQHKVTVGDLVQAEKLHRREAGDKVSVGTEGPEKAPARRGDLRKRPAND